MQFNSNEDKAIVKKKKKIAKIYSILQFLKSSRKNKF